MIYGDRKLASIRKINQISPINGADKIILLTIDGWQLVSSIDSGFRENDLCVMFEIDSFLPVREEFEFLRKSSFKSTKEYGDGFRLKTIKMRNQVSQGLAVPLHTLFQYATDTKQYYYDMPNCVHGRVYLNENDDVTEYLQIQKYEKPLSHQGGSGANFGKSTGSFPSFLRKTDQERIQNCYNGIKQYIRVERSETIEVSEDQINIDPDATYFQSGDLWFKRSFVLNPPEIMEENDQFETTIKLDGSSMTVYHNNNSYGVCSRNLEVSRDYGGVSWKVALSSGIINALVNAGRNVAIQGELMGPGVQGNRENLPDHKLFVFDVYDIDEKRYMTPMERNEFLNKLNIIGENEYIDHVPYFDTVKFSDFPSVADFLKYAEKPSLHNPIAEGVVFKSVKPNGPTFKAISNKFLLAEKD